MGNKSEKKKKHPSNLNHPLVCACFTRGNVFAHGEVDTKDLKEVELSDVPKGRLSLRCFYESVGMPKGGVEGMPGAWGGWVCGSCWLLVDGWWLGSKKGQFFLETRHFLGGCKAAKFHLIYAVTFKCIHKEIHGLESTTQYGSQN